MERFFAVMWKTPSPGCAARVQSVAGRICAVSHLWQEVLSIEGLRVWRASPQYSRLRLHAVRKEGVILGTLFPHRVATVPTMAIASLPDCECDSIVASSGRALATKYWGQYVAILRDAAGSTHSMRDPAGAQACSYSFDGELTYVFSHFSDLVKFSSQALTVNHGHVAACLELHFFPPSKETGFNEAFTLQPGECLTVRSGERTTSFYWSALEHCRAPPEEDVGEATKHLRAAVSTTVESWGSCLPKVLHELSGGLDSSIVLSCLMQSKQPDQVVCVNYYTDLPEGDERSHARTVARHCGVELIELPISRSMGTSMADFISDHGAISPLMTLFRCDIDQRRSVAEKFGVDGMTSGQGGDQLFQRAVRDVDAADYIRNNGIRSAFLPVLISTAQAAKRSFWSTAKAAIWHGALRRQFDVSDIYELGRPCFLPAEAINLRKYIHPWFQQATNIPPGKLLQLLCIAESSSCWAMECQFSDEVFPLISQPIIEQSLRIPVYVLSHAGHERALIRRAFQSAIPQEIASRRSKGAVTQFGFQVISAYWTFIRELIADGHLVADHFIDKAAIDNVLSHEPDFDGGAFIWHIITACKCEMWLRYAKSCSRQSTSH